MISQTPSKHIVKVQRSLDGRPVYLHEKFTISFHKLRDVTVKIYAFLKY